jgi:uncharacterized protein (DUF427 family)
MTGGDGVRVERSERRVRVMLGGEFVADTIAPLLAWETPFYPTYFFPESDLRTEALRPTGDNRKTRIGETAQYSLSVGEFEGVAYAYPDVEELEGHYAFVWKTVDHWFEEDEEVFVHARDPYTRIDILPSGRRVRVDVDGVTVADSTKASFLFETNLPTRYYFPKTDVRMDLLTPTDKATHCPYKGTARYWSLIVNGETYQDIVWGYDAAFPESQKITGLVSFYNEKVNIYVDEVLQERPKTKFS